MLQPGLTSPLSSHADGAVVADPIVLQSGWTSPLSSRTDCNSIGKVADPIVLQPGLTSPLSSHADGAGGSAPLSLSDNVMDSLEFIAFSIMIRGYWVPLCFICLKL